MHKIKIFNTLNGRVQELKPIKGKLIRLFVCGPTVYDFPHIGNARTYIVFDSFAKFLKKMGFKVFYLQNITDLDDKIIASSREKGVPPKALAKTFETEYLKNMKDLRVTSVTKYAKATAQIKEIINQIKRLEKKGYAYQLDDGIYFNIAKFKGYGKLSGRSALQSEDSVSRVDYNRNKINRGDFCLWKFSLADEPKWPSPWGQGRPGWHIEDTAITEKFFGPQYEIHGGARDLMFPHHEAEITQMEAISDKKPMVKYWLHTGFLTVEGQKMSKSLNNFIRISDFLKRSSPESIRFLILKNLWHSGIDYSESLLVEVKSNLERIEEFLKKLINVKKTRGKNITKDITRLKKDFYEKLKNNFNTPESFAIIFDFIKRINLLLSKDLLSKKDANSIYKFFEEINTIFEIIDFKKIKKITIPSSIENIIKEREVYRKAGDWEKSDELRVKIEKQGFIIEDTKEGPKIQKIN